MVTYDVDTPAQYLAVQSADWRRDTMLRLREIIKATMPDWQETINYKMLGYGPPGRPAIHLNVQKNYVGLYVGDIAKIDPDGVLLGPIDRGKGCIRFKRKNIVEHSGVGQFLLRYKDLHDRGEDMGC